MAQYVPRPSCHGKTTICPAATGATTAQICSPIPPRTKVWAAQLCGQLCGVSAAGQPPQLLRAGLHPSSRCRHHITGMPPSVFALFPTCIKHEYVHTVGVASEWCALAIVFISRFRSTSRSQPPPPVTPLPIGFVYRRFILLSQHHSGAGCRGGSAVISIHPPAASTGRVCGSCGVVFKV